MSDKPKWTPGPSEYREWMAGREDEAADLSCGCRMRREGRTVLFARCPLHTAAPLMVEALEAVVREADNAFDYEGNIERMPDLVRATNKARNALRAARGED